MTDFWNGFYSIVNSNTFGEIFGMACIGITLCFLAFLVYVACMLIVIYVQRKISL